MSSSVADVAQSPVLGRQPLDLACLPPVLLLEGRGSPGYMDDFGNSLRKCNATVVRDAKEARLFVGLVNTKKRAQFELRRAGITIEDEPQSEASMTPKQWQRSDEILVRPRKRPTLHHRLLSSNLSKTEEVEVVLQAQKSAEDLELEFPWQSRGTAQNDIYVLKLSWLQESLAKDYLLDPQDYMVYTGKRHAPQIIHTDDINHQDRLLHSQSQHPEPSSQLVSQRAYPDGIQQRAVEDGTNTTSSSTRFTSAPYGRRRFRDHHQAGKLGISDSRPKLLDLETTSFEDSPDHDMPSVPDWVVSNKKYSCQRVTLEHSPNEEFIGLLMKIRLARLLTGDEIGVRAYSSSIAAIAAIDTKFVNPREILRLPGCDVKIANLWVEYKNTGAIQAAKEVDEDDTLKVLNDFYDIWGVGEKTAREFYYDKGWRDRDDILEYGWHTLTRRQQIGLKYYDEFQLGIPRVEVEHILDVVRRHAVKIRDNGIEAIVVGGYRRGKAESGDVDIVLSHRDLDMTANLVMDLVASLEEEGWITHTLSLHLTATKRDQATLPFKSQDKHPGTGFDTLDKALVVWQDIAWPSKLADRRKDPKIKNPNVHRRVDIIISPWRTVGCAVLGWSGGTTFQRDVRRYAKYVKQWKFDSSGIRSRINGEVIQLEGKHGVEGTMVDAEKAVFAGLGLDYRAPEERWTR